MIRFKQALQQLKVSRMSSKFELLMNSQSEKKMNLRNNFKIGMVPALMVMVLSQHSAQAQVCQPSNNGTKALLDLMKGSSDLKQVSHIAPAVPDEWTRKLILVNPKGTPFEALSSDGLLS